MTHLTIAQEEHLSYAICNKIAYDRRQAAYMIHAMMEQLQNSHLTVDYKITLSRQVAAARRKWCRDYFIDLDSYSLIELMRYACSVQDWSRRLSDLFTTNARMIRDRMSRIREINFNRRHLQWCF
ncbi:hypothetical protein GCK72_024490 [Caenorhabditis remanei]|uniref:Uncharacterized protein n=1 Tax=Caenorhabditis remanei TaxID=31234 RepID=A0A6A5FZN5_CAERE|nr:hypothetical protein GCK72_024490 [Caenorhabditis remanei]KAF1748023.1 hypothetical protein GCK72_024490 [Caenorhabditis remanei]